MTGTDSLGYLVGRAAPRSRSMWACPRGPRSVAECRSYDRIPGSSEYAQMNLGTIFVFVACVVAAWFGTALAVHLAHGRTIRLRLERLPGAVAVVVAFGFVTALALASLVAFGFATNVTLEPIDRPGYEWLVAEAAVTGTAHDVIDFLTQAGDPTPMALVGAVTMLAFTFGWGRRDRIIVPLLVGGTFLSAWVLQRVTEYLVGRDSPPLGAGTFPSGGSARILCVTVLVVILAAMRWQWPATGRRIGWYVAATLGALEGFTRLVLLIHWPTDVIAGWAAGAATAFAAILAVALWESRSPDELPPKYPPPEDGGIGGTARLR
jgi:membrane-associated phospholipid phosphatase